MELGMIFPFLSPVASSNFCDLYSLRRWISLCLFLQLRQDMKTVKKLYDSEICKWNIDRWTTLFVCTLVGMLRYRSQMFAKKDLERTSEKIIPSSNSCAACSHVARLWRHPHSWSFQSFNLYNKIHIWELAGLEGFLFSIYAAACTSFSIRWSFIFFIVESFYIGFFNMIMIKRAPQMISVNSPAMPAPPGLHSDLVNPSDLNTEGLILIIICLTLSTLVVGMRVWTKSRLIGKMVLEDCMPGSLLCSSPSLICWSFQGFLA